GCGLVPEPAASRPKGPGSVYPAVHIAGSERVERRSSGVVMCAQVSLRSQRRNSCELVRQTGGKRPPLGRGGSDPAEGAARLHMEKGRKGPNRDVDMTERRRPRQTPSPRGVVGAYVRCVLSRWARGATRRRRTVARYRGRLSTYGRLGPGR